MEGKQVLRTLKLRNMLSFGVESPAVELGPLNVLIGPNGSGKSNVLEALDLLRALPRDLAVPIRAGGGIDEWIWKGARGGFAEVETTWDYVPGSPPLRHRIALRSQELRAKVAGEFVSQGTYGTPSYMGHYGFSSLPHGQNDHRYFHDNVEGTLLLNTSSNILDDASILSQRWDPERYPSLVFLDDQFTKILLYRNWIAGSNAPIRSAQRGDLPGDYLLEDYSNAGLVLHNLMNDRETRRTVLVTLGRLYEGATDIRTKIVSGYVQLNVEEEDGRLIPAARLSDGTLRYLCLLAILCHPTPPPLIGIEEPELGLHPDVIPDIAKLLISASQRTQLVVTTHSAALVSALGEVPEAVVVCERGIDGTTLRRLDAERLQKWLEDYTLGDLWTMGEIGGNRW